LVNKKNSEARQKKQGEAKEDGGPAIEQAYTENIPKKNEENHRQKGAVRALGALRKRPSGDDGAGALDPTNQTVQAG